MNNQEERWHHCEVPYTRYMVSNLGRVKNAHTGRILKSKLQFNGYRVLGLSYKGEVKMKFVHRLVALAFVPGYQKGLQVNHKNGVKNDNRVENLEWVTPSENTRHGRDILLKLVHPVALFDERGHLQYVYHSAHACNMAMGGNVREHIRRKERFHGLRPLYISVPMYREILHLVNVHRHTLHSAWIEANLNIDSDESK